MCKNTFPAFIDLYHLIHSFISRRGLLLIMFLLSLNVMDLLKLFQESQVKDFDTIPHILVVRVNPLILGVQNFFFRLPSQYFS